MIIIPENHLHLSMTDEFEIITKFKGKELVWDASEIKKTRYKSDPFDLFKEINLYLETQPTEVSEGIFEAYQQIHDIFYKDNISLNEQITKLTRLVASLYKELEFGSLKEWLRTYRGIVIPSTFHDVYLDHSGIDLDDFKMTSPDKKLEKSNVVQAATREKTYLREDYVDLVVLTVMLRLMIPVWMMFIVLTKDKTSNDFKEHYAGQLLALSKNVLNSPGYEKLFTYLYENIKDQGVANARNNSLAGLSTEDYPQYVMNLILIRRITIGDIRGLTRPGQSSTFHLVTYIHSYLQQAVFKSTKRFDLELIRDKFDSRIKGGQDDDKKISIFESVRISESLSPGDIKEIEFYFNDPDRIIRVLCPDLPKRLRDDALAHAKRLINNDIHEPQVKILKNLIGPFLSPSVIDNLTAKYVMDLLCLVQAMLWYRGEKKIATIMTLTQLPINENALSAGSRSNATAQQQELSKQLYPHHKLVGGRINQNTTPVNIEWVKTIMRELTDYDWRYHIHPNWDIDQPHIAGLRPNEYRIPSDIRVRLMDLTLRIAKYRFPLHKENWDKPLYD